MYYSRKLRFDDIFSPQYKRLFSLDENQPIRILEIGCGPGALAGALHRWYPNAEITAIDRDSEFIKFATEQEKGITFLEGDATNLPFADNTFDVTISNTVAEHVEPARFYTEQLRVLKPGGMCIVLTSRKSIRNTADCLKPTPEEIEFWEKLEANDNTSAQYGVGQYWMSEQDMPVTMEHYGFQSVCTDYIALDLTPDNPRFSPAFAHSIINAERYAELENLHSVQEHTSAQEIGNIKRMINGRYDKRIRLYDSGNRQWDTNMSIIMILRGIK